MKYAIMCRAESVGDGIYMYIERENLRAVDMADGMLDDGEPECRYVFVAAIESDSKDGAIDGFLNFVSTIKPLPVAENQRCYIGTIKLDS